MFQLYACKVRLNNVRDNEVPKEITAPEYHVLKAIHAPPDGEDPIIEVKALPRDLDHNDAVERARLSSMYGHALSTNEELKSINGIFGPMAPLPKIIPGVGLAEVQKDELDSL
jgi:hypothetical protein